MPAFLDGTGISIGRGNENKVFSINIVKKINKKQFARSFINRKSLYSRYIAIITGMSHFQ